MKTCNVCGLPKPPEQFTKNCKSPDGRLSRCKTCDKKVRLHRYRTVPRVRASAVWHALLQRVGNANGKNDSYANTQVAFTKDTFVAWYSAALPVFFADHGVDATPSVDRVEQDGHYSPGNVRLIPLGDNSMRARNKRNVNAPAGTAWCTHCKKYLPRSDFYKNRAQAHGLTHSCKRHFKSSS